MFKLFVSILTTLALINPITLHADDASTKNIPFYVSGVMPQSDSSHDLLEFSRWITKQTGMRFSLQFTDTYQQLTSGLRNQPTGLGWTCGWPFVEDHDQDQQQLVAVPLFHGEPLYHSLIVTNRNHPHAKTIMDFEDGIFAYSDPRSNSGYLAPAVALKKKGKVLPEFFRMVQHAGTHEGSIMSVLAGAADVAAIDEFVLESHFRDHPEDRSRLIVLEKLGPFPFTPIVAGKDMPAEKVQRLRQALVSMSTDKQGQRLLKNLRLDGFVAKPPEFYRPIREMLSQVDSSQRVTPF